MVDFNDGKRGPLQVRELKNWFSKAEDYLNLIHKRTGQTYKIVPVETPTNPVKEVKNDRPSKREPLDE